MRDLIRLMRDPGPGDRIVPAVVRLLLAAVFIPAGIGKFTNHDAYITRFDRWGFPEPGSVAYLVGAVEVVFGLLMLAGILPRLVGLVLMGNMAGALVTAGRVDGGQNIWLPIVLIVLSGVVVWLGAGRFRLTPPGPLRPAGP